MKNRYIFLLGKTPLLSQEEIRSLFKPQEVIDARYSFVVVETEREPDYRFLHRLGGVLSIAKVLDREIHEYLLEHATEGKLVYGLSLLGEKPFLLKRMLLDTKKKLKAAGASSRFVNKDFNNLSTVQIAKEGLMKRETHIVVCSGGKTRYVGVTIAIQDFHSYAARDYHKPFRDARMGMLPPKLAQMMLNIATRGRTDVTVYDPFCGSGTVLVEGLLLGCDVTGSDISERNIDGTRVNVQWALNEYKLDPEKAKDIFVHDAREKFPKLPSNTVIVTEGYLGPPRRMLPSETMQLKIFEEIHELYQNFFLRLSTSLSKGSRVCITLPFFRSKTPYYFPFRGAYIQNGFKVIPFFVPHLNYERDEQIVGREVVIFERM